MWQREREIGREDKTRKERKRRCHGESMKCVSGKGEKRDKQRAGSLSGL